MNKGRAAWRWYDRRGWDAALTLEALGAAGVALWTWTPSEDRLRFTGSARTLGLGPLAPECSSAALRALVLPQDRVLAEELLREQPPHSEISLRLRMRGGEIGVWRGVWLEEGSRAAGVVAPETAFAASEHDPLTGLLDAAAASWPAPASGCRPTAPSPWWSPTSTACAA